MATTGLLVRTMCECGEYPTLSKGRNTKGQQVFGTACKRCIVEARKFKKNQCEVCYVMPENKGSLEVDHIDGNKSNNRASNLQTLCKSCHIEKTRANKEYLSRKDLSMNKLCIKCNISKHVDDFHKSSKLSDGRQTYCKSCLNAMNKVKYDERMVNGPTIHRDSKTCAKCKDKKPISQFGKRSGSPDGHLSYCKPCWTNMTKKAKAKNK
jgi:hypothetical protein